MADLPDPVGCTTSVSCPRRRERIASDWPGRSPEKPSSFRAAAAMSGEAFLAEKASVLLLEDDIRCEGPGDSFLSYLSEMQKCHVPEPPVSASRLPQLGSLG